MSKNNKFILSIIVISHSEGKIAGRTLRSLTRATEELKKKNINYQVLVNIDKGDVRTIEFFKEAVKDLNGKIYYTNYGDPGLARNFIIKKAEGEYVTLIDADDIVSTNWLVEGLKKIMSAKEPVLAHPEVEIRFDTEKICSVDVRVEYEDNWRETLALFEGNRWCAIVMGRKEYFVENPYSASRCGFGYEDYYFNCSTVAAEIKHVVAKKTTAFCLQKKGSVSDITHESNMILPYNELFDLRRLQRIAKEKQLPEVVYSRKDSTDDKKLLDFIKSEIQTMTKIESEISYINKNLSKIKVNQNDKKGDLIIGILFCRMIVGINLRFLPKIIVFGDESNKSTGKIMERLKWVVLTEPTKDAVINAPNVLDFGFNFGKAPIAVQNVVLERLIVQSKVKRIVGNSFAGMWLKSHSNFLKQNHIRYTLLDK